ANPNTSGLFEEQIRVSPDKATNSLVITASQSDFVTIQRVISKLDIPRDEVFVEFVIMEVAVSGNTNFSSNFASPTSGISLTPSGDLLNFIQNPLSQKGLVLGLQGGKSTT